MAIRLESPPIRERMLDENGFLTPIWASYMVRHYSKTGGAEAVLPVTLGGTGGGTATEAIAVQTAASSASGGGSSSSAETKRQTFALNSPPSGDPGDSADTTVVWDTPFADANYIVTASFIGSSGETSVGAVTATGFTITLTNTGRVSSRFPEGVIASGSADCIGVHA